MAIYNVVAVCGILALGVTGAQAADWPNWRGPNLDGISAETEWNPLALKEPRIVWQAEIGIGFSSVSVADGKAYVMGNVNKKTDVVYCFDALAGKEIWRFEYPESLDPKYYEGGTSATPTVHQGRVYTLSKSGKLFCLDAASGKVVWEHTFRHKNPTWGFSSSGVIVGDAILFNVGAAGAAISKQDGKILWDSADDESGYASPVPFKTPDGKTLVAIFGKESLMAVDPNNGAVQWSYPWKTQHNVNAADPVIVGSEALITSGYNRGAALLNIAAAPTAIWEDKTMRSQMSGPVRIGDYIYGIDQNQLACVEWKTGKQLWTERKVGNGALSAAGDKLIVVSEQGYLLIAEATPDGFRELSGASVLRARCWAPPILSNGHIYVRNSQGTLLCIDVRSERTAANQPLAGSSCQWPQWRGTHRDGVSRQAGLLHKWPDGGPQKQWTIEGLGEGYSSVSIADGSIYTTGMIDRQGWLFCFDKEGKEHWRQPYGPEWHGSYSGARSTPAVSDGLVYVISGNGQIACFDAAAGTPRWKTDALTLYNGRHGSWGVAESPLVVDNLVLVTVGSQQTLLAAFDKTTGDPVWTTPGKGQRGAYCSPLAVQWAGKTLILGAVDDYLFMVDAGDGTLVWSFPVADYTAEANRGIHPNTPVFHNGRFFFSSGYNVGGIQFEISQDAKTVTETWRTTAMDTHHGGFVLFEGFIYGTNWDSNNNGKWVCLDWQTGQVRYETAWHTKGSLTLADGMLYCYEEKNGHIALVPAMPDRFEPVSVFSITQGQGPHWSHPVVCGKQLYIRHGSTLTAYDIAAHPI